MTTYLQREHLHKTIKDLSNLEEQHREEMERMRELEDGKCSQMSSGHDIYAVLVNSHWQWLAAQVQHKVNAAKTLS